MNLSLSLHGPLVAAAVMVRGTIKDFWVVKVRANEDSDNPLTIFAPTKEGAEAIADAINSAFSDEQSKARAA